MLQPIPSSLGTQGGVSIIIPMQSVSGLVVSIVVTIIPPFLIWGTSSVPSFPSIFLPSISPSVSPLQTSTSRVQFIGGRIFPAHTSCLQATPISL